nr:hypothetical protein BaRGS_032252 [Batillaria attramentaria]
MLTVRLDDVKKEEEGQWLLELTNDVGTGHVDFELKVSESTGEETESDTTEATSGVDVHLIGGLVIGVNVGTVIIVTIVVLIIGARFEFPTLASSEVTAAEHARYKLLEEPVDNDKQRKSKKVRHASRSARVLNSSTPTDQQKQ